MGILDSFKKNREAGKEQITPPPRGHTLAEILQDKHNSHLFGKMLEMDGHQDLALRLIEGKLERDDINLLEEQRLKFSEKVTQSEKIGRLLTEENVIEIARNHPDFATIINLVGPKKAIKAIQGQLKAMCITEEYRFNAIAGPIETYDSYKNGEYKKTNDKVEKLCKDMGITPKEYLDALAIEDPEEKKATLKKLARGQYGKFQTAWNKISGKERKNFRDLKGSETLMESSVAQLDGYRDDIGYTLFYSISGNDDMRNALTRELLSENAPAIETENGFGDAKKETASAFNEREFDRDWEAYKKQMTYDTSTDSEKDYLKDAFIDNKKEAYRKKSVKAKGFWGSIFATLFEGKINSKRDTLK